AQAEGRVRAEPPAVERRPGDSMCPAALVVAALLLLHAFDDGESEHDGSSCRGHRHAVHHKHDGGRRFAYVISEAEGANGYVLRLAVALHRFSNIRCVCGLAIAGLVRRLDDLYIEGTEPTTRADGRDLDDRRVIEGDRALMDVHRGGRTSNLSRRRGAQARQYQ